MADAHEVLEKIQSVLDLADDQPFEGFATFEQEDEDLLDAWNKQYHMPQEEWEDMGRPEVVTITVRPGDLLNLDHEPSD